MDEAVVPLSLGVELNVHLEARELGRNARTRLFLCLLVLRTAAAKRARDVVDVEQILHLQ